MEPTMPRRKRFACVLMTLAAACAPAPRPTATAPPPAPAPRGAALLRSAMMAGHNAARAAVGVAPLAWDETLAVAAQAHADALAATGQLRHAVQAKNVARQGENLWIGVRGAFRYDEMVGLWVDERSDFVDAPTPDFSRSGQWTKVAHYAQIVWRGTTQIGCALASNAEDDFLVCRYAPAGNILGQRAF
jgi:hypothetical protein